MKPLKLAERKASESTFMRARVGAIITKGGRVLSTGHNSTRYNHHLGKSWPSIHAEEQAILRILALPDGHRILKGSTLYVVRLGKDNVPRLAKPCPTCQKLIDSVGIKRVIYSE